MYTFQLGERSLTIRQTRPEESAASLALLVATARWIQSTGSIQWSHYLEAGDEEAVELAAEATKGELYGVYAGERLVATVSLLGAQGEWDVHLWGPDQGEATYLHRLAVDRSLRGQGLGLQILDWALLRTKELGKEFLRLDCAAWVDALHHFYSQRLEFKGTGDAFGLRFKKWERRVGSLLPSR
jgi:GNAT superfamily N-acetyltransferase